MQAYAVFGLSRKKIYKSACLLNFPNLKES